MKKTAVILGVLAVLLSLFQGGRYIFDYYELSEYGKGFIWGNIILFVAGVLLIITGRRKKKRDTE